MQLTTLFVLALRRVICVAANMYTATVLNLTLKIFHGDIWLSENMTYSWEGEVLRRSPF